MEDRVEHLRARAMEVRRLAEWAKDPTIRTELLSIASQYDSMAEDIVVARAQRRAPIYIVTRKAENPRRE